MEFKSEHWNKLVQKTDLLANLVNDFQRKVVNAMDMEDKEIRSFIRVLELAAKDLRVILESGSNEPQCNGKCEKDIRDPSHISPDCRYHGEKKSSDKWKLTKLGLHFLPHSFSNVHIMTYDSFLKANVCLKGSLLGGDEKFFELEELEEAKLWCEERLPKGSF